VLAGKVSNRCKVYKPNHSFHTSFFLSFADIHQAIEEAIEGSSGLSFIDDVTWLIEASGIPQLIRKMEKYARLYQAWAQRNSVRFETSKMEAILLSRNRKHYKERDTMKIRVGEHHAKFNSEATRWLGVWIDLALRLTTHQDKCMARARMAENRSRGLVSKYGVPPASARNIQIAIIQWTLMYGAELSWNGKILEARD
jgi:hypothetical protein